MSQPIQLHSSSPESEADSQPSSPQADLASEANQRPQRQDYRDLPRHSLIVCASLVQNPTNLGGLCRTAEAFRLEALVLADPRLIQQPLFRAVAASTHLWQPVQFCPVAQLPLWLQQQRQAGYAILALDAHPDAHPLPRFQFPLRSVLLLGQELTGIPPALQALADHRLTIPQFGLVESLNVQTAAAIAGYEYVRQASLPLKPASPYQSKSAPSDPASG